MAPADPAAPIPNDLDAALHAGGCYAVWQTEHHLTYVWCEGAAFKAEVWVNGQPQEVIDGTSFDDLRENVELFYGAGLD